MQSSPCHAPDSPVDEPRDLIKRVLTVRRVAGWCNVTEAAVHQWLHRGTSDAPVPATRVPLIAAGAASEGIEFDLGVLWPAMAGTLASRFGQARQREDVQ